jgi:hypothetical protein
MSHVDEGTLHAYLDDELPTAERAAIESHVTQCPTCRARLAEERALRERATALLGGARPREPAPPPFEQLRRAAPRQPSPWRVRTPLAWAASIALALGAGYYLHHPSVGTEHFAPAREDHAVAPPASAAPAGVARSTAKTSVAQREPTRRRARAERQDTSAQVERLDSSANGVVALQPRVSLRNRAPIAVGGNAPPATAARDSVPAEARVAAPPVARRARQPLVPRELTATTWPVISRGAAASLLGEKPVGVPGVATRGIRRSPGLDSTVVVEQALDSSTVIEIFQRPASAATATSPALSDAVRGYAFYDRNDRLLGRFVGRLRVEIAGPLSTDSLNRLLELVEPLP